MRDFKFRAWSKKDKRMVYLAESMASSIHLQMNNHSWGIFEPDKENYCGGATLNKHFNDVLMQYTGLNDKNGKEIYEGDKCLVERPCVGAVGIIKFHQGCFIFVENHTGNLLRLCDLKLNNYTIEVIGNIYENSELLESEVE